MMIAINAVKMTAQIAEVTAGLTCIHEGNVVLTPAIDQCSCGDKWNECAEQHRAHRIAKKCSEWPAFRARRCRHSDAREKETASRRKCDRNDVSTVKQRCSVAIAHENDRTN